jgi:hypothetical protein
MTKMYQTPAKPTPQPSGAERRSNLRTFHDLQHFFLHVQIPVCIVGAYLGFPKIVAVGTPADGDEGRRLDSFGYGKSGKKVPPALQVLNESGVGGKEVFYLYGTAQMLFQRSFPVPGQDVLRRISLPGFYKAFQQIVMVFVNERIPQAFGDILFFGQFGTGFYGENPFW